MFQNEKNLKGICRFEVKTTNLPQQATIKLFHNPLKHIVLMGYLFTIIPQLTRNNQYRNFATSKAMKNDIAQTIRQTKCVNHSTHGESRNIKSIILWQQI